MIATAKNGTVTATLEGAQCNSKRFASAYKFNQLFNGDKCVFSSCSKGHN